MNIRSLAWKAAGVALAVPLLTFWGCGRQKEQAGSTPQVVTTKTGIEMVVLPGGSFEMGSAKGTPDEAPVHKVQLRPFWMDRHEVVQEEFRKYQLPDPSHFKGPKQPLEQINWTDATLYCNERSRAEGLQPCYNEETWACDFSANGYRLPTEAEWEYACRAGTSTAYGFGDSAGRLKEHAWYADNAGGKTHPVGQKKPNAWGLYDMHGNVAEWCNDLYVEGYYQQSPAQDPRGPAEGKERVLRGGAWNSTAASCRSAYRASDPSIDDTCLANDAIGFRCVRNTPAPSSVGVPPMKAGRMLLPMASVFRPWIQDHGQDARATAGGGIMPTEPKSKTGFVYDDIYLQHETTPGHPERPERLTAILGRLQTTGLYTRLVPITPHAAAAKWIETIHTPAYVARVKRSCEEGEPYLDSGDTPISTKSYEAAVMAAGGVLAAVDAVMRGEVTNAFCAIRPPGHHATADRAMGFCIFNNVAIGTRYVQKQYNLAKVLIVDWDVHHGNGTQAAFYDDPSVLYFSVHQYPFYPGSGSEAEKGRGKGLNYTINVPLPRGSGDEEYVEVFEKRLRPAARVFAPDFVFVSAGFDAHEDDTLGGMRVTTEGFGRLTRIVKEIADGSCKGRLVSVLEGGYNLEGLAAAVETHLRVLVD
jgi:acetoin utilization deacetylase AcuC-like enzyme/formylglycine-generating enzyme required for sulfatase activity